GGVARVGGAGAESDRGPLAADGHLHQPDLHRLAEVDQETHARLQPAEVGPVVRVAGPTGVFVAVNDQLSVFKLRSVALGRIDDADLVRADRDRLIARNRTRRLDRRGSRLGRRRAAEQPRPDQRADDGEYGQAGNPQGELAGDAPAWPGRAAEAHRALVAFVVVLVVVLGLCVVDAREPGEL